MYMTRRHMAGRSGKGTSPLILCARCARATMIPKPISFSAAST
jgi:hypothetical protein